MDAAIPQPIDYVHLHRNVYFAPASATGPADRFRQPPAAGRHQKIPTNFSEEDPVVGEF